jgi:hypothetical protein
MAGIRLVFGNSTETHRVEKRSTWTWWQSQRRRYNVWLIAAALICALSLMVIWAFFETRLPCLEVTFFTLLFQGILFVIGLGVANVCYFFGPLSEKFLRPRNVVAFRRWAFRAGTSFSLLLIFLPVLLNLIAVVRGPTGLETCN